MSRLNEMQELEITRRISRLRGRLNELKVGRAFTSGKSGVIAYNVGSDAWDTMKRPDGTIIGTSLKLTNTGQMNYGKSILIRTKYIPKYQDFPITAPFMRINTNGQDLVRYADGGYPPWRSGDGSTWNLNASGYLQETVGYYGIKKLQQWETYLNYAGTAELTIKINTQIKSTDKGQIITEVVVY